VEKQRPAGTADPCAHRLHFGEVLFKNGDVHGDTSNIAAKVTAITRAQQIMTDHTVVKLLSDDCAQNDPSYAHRVPRQDQGLRVFHVTGSAKVADAAAAARISQAGPESRQELMLRYRDKSSC